MALCVHLIKTYANNKKRPSLTSKNPELFRLDVEHWLLSIQLLLRAQVKSALWPNDGVASGASLLSGCFWDEWKMFHAMPENNKMYVCTRL